MTTRIQIYDADSLFHADLPSLEDVANDSVHYQKRQRIWIAEQDGERVGSVMIADAGDQIAQLRLLLFTDSKWQ